MPTDIALLTLSQWLSLSYPVGSFSYSHGLESAVDQERVQDADDLQDWIATVLRHGAGRSDAVFLAAGYRASDATEVVQVDELCRAFSASAERLIETERQGLSFCKVTRAVWRLDLADLCYPVAVGRAARLCALPLEATAMLYLQAFAANLVFAGQRLAPVGQDRAQAIVQTLAPQCALLATQTSAGDLDTLTGTAFLADIASMTHETQYSRMFQT